MICYVPGSAGIAFMGFVAGVLLGILLAEFRR